VGLFDDLGVLLSLLVLGQRPVDAGQAWVSSFAFAAGVIRSGRIDSTDSPLARRRSTVCSMSSVMTGGRPPWFPLRAAAFSPSKVASRMFSRSVSAIAAKNANSTRPVPVGS
jgi:hypothetical protein